MSQKMKSIPPVQLSIVIPCYNEEGSIEKTISNILPVILARNIYFEIICVNNNSLDGTQNILRRLAYNTDFIHYYDSPKELGYGIAVRAGLENCRGDVVIIVMADGSEEPSEIIKFYDKIHSGYDCIFGNRFSKNSNYEEYGALKLKVNRAGNWLVSWITKTKFTDFTNGFKCYRKSLLDIMPPLVSSSFNLNLEMSLNSIFLGARIAEIENSWKERVSGKSKFNVYHESKLYLVTLVTVFFRFKLSIMKDLVVSLFR